MAEPSVIRELAVAVEAMGMLLEEMLDLEWTQKAPTPGQLGRMRILARVAHDRAELIGEQLRKAG